MKTVLIIGASGTIGLRLLEEIQLLGLDKRKRIICASRSDVSARKIRDAGFDPVFLNLDDAQSIISALDGVDTIFLLKPYAIRMLNQAKSVVDAAVAASVGAIVNVSAFGPNSSAIDLLTWHRLVDSYIENSGIAFTHLRPAFFMEGLVARTDHAAGLIHDLCGGGPTPWVAASDVAKAAAYIISDPAIHCSKAYSLVSEVQSIPQAAQLMSQLTEKEYNASNLDEGTAIKGLIERGREPLFARAIVEYGKNAPSFPAQDALTTIQTITGQAAVSLHKFLGQLS